MSFKFRRFFSLTASLIFGAFCCLVGAFFVTLPWSLFLQNAATDLIVNHTLILSLFGLGLVLIGLSIVIYALFNLGYRYAYIKVGNRSVALDENLIEEYLQHYWKENFPLNQIPFYLSITKNSIQIVADLPPVPEADQDHFLDKIREDFSHLFSNVLGYQNEIFFIAHFQNEPSEPYP
jgi:hypothetical protein